jgi:hypothetical protein
MGDFVPVKTGIGQADELSDSALKQSRFITEITDVLLMHLKARNPTLKTMKKNTRKSQAERGSGYLTYSVKDVFFYHVKTCWDRPTSRTEYLAYDVCGYSSWRYGASLFRHLVECHVHTAKGAGTGQEGWSWRCGAQRGCKYLPTYLLVCVFAHLIFRLPT